MAKKQIKVTELVLRDAHQSLLATRMKIEHMLPILRALVRGISSPVADKIDKFRIYRVYFFRLFCTAKLTIGH